MAEYLPVRTGDWVREDTLCQNLEPGIAPSRENAYIIREFDVTEKVLQSMCELLRNSYSITRDSYPQRYIDTITMTCNMSIGQSAAKNVSMQYAIKNKPSTR